MSRETRTRTKQKKPATRAKEPCNGCPAECCHELALVVEKPRTRSDIDFYKWQLQYDTVRIAISNYRWYTITAGRCIYLDEHNRCTIYDRRPDKCRRHNPPECEHFGTWYDVMLATPEELEAYLEKEKLRRKRRAAARRKKARARK